MRPKGTHYSAPPCNARRTAMQTTSHRTAPHRTAPHHSSTQYNTMQYDSTQGIDEIGDNVDDSLSGQLRMLHAFWMHLRCVCVRGRVREHACSCSCVRACVVCVQRPPARACCGRLCLRLCPSVRTRQLARSRSPHRRPLYYVSSQDTDNRRRPDDEVRCRLSVRHLCLIACSASAL